MKKMIRFIGAFVLSLLVLMPAAPPAFADVQTTKVTNNVNEVREAIEDTTNFMLQKGVSSEWEAIGLAKAGKAVPASYIEKFDEHLHDQVIGQSGNGRMKITDVERLTMAAVAIGKDPTNIDGNGFNLIEKIYDSEHRKTGEDSLTFQGNNGIIFALIALDAKDYYVPSGAKWTREKLVAELLSNQREDGSWSLSTAAKDSPSFDITAMALISLAPYTDDSVVKTAVDKTVSFLSNAQDPTGGFNEAFVGGISSEATSQVVIGLTANGIDPQGEQFTKNGNNLIDHLLSFKAADGGFKHTSNDTTSNGMATEQALQALVAFDLYTRDAGRLYDFNEGYENNKSWTITFSGQVDETYLTSNEHIYVVDAAGNTLENVLTIDESGKKVVVQPPVNLYQSGGYTLHIESSLKSVNGKNLNQGETKNFEIN